MKSAFTIVLVLGLCGCASTQDWMAREVSKATDPIAYKPPTRQGNVLDQRDFDKLRVGMSKDQVRYVLGTPIGTSPFTPERWDYVGYYKSPRGEVTFRNITLKFDGDKLASMQGVSAEQDKTALSTPDAKALAAEERMYRTEDSRAGDNQDRRIQVNAPSAPNTPIISGGP